ncbi:Sigma-70 region 2 [Clostridiales bacterium oral taxon 876 str. F0540]|nr:Sigma-70 region 2 [Clostridiales bacterium oral taxon 876 str. F0540]
MNHNEIETCVIRIKSGSEEDFDKLIKQFRPFIYKTANSFNIRNYDIDDLAQLGNIALMKAVLKYKVGSHTFSSYAFNSIKNELRFAARTNAKISNELSINTPVYDSEQQDTEFVDCLEDPNNLEEDIIQSESIKELKEAIELLSDEEIEFVNLVYYKELPLTKYAEHKNLSYQQALTRKRKVLKKLGIYLRKR